MHKTLGYLMYTADELADAELLDELLDDMLLAELEDELSAADVFTALP
jgi:hypothetical protein